jgi:hypothetical protein
VSAVERPGDRPVPPARAARDAESAPDRPIPPARSSRPTRARRGARGLAVALTVGAVAAGAALIGVGAWSLASGGDAPAVGAVERRAVEPLGGRLLAPPAAAPHGVRIPAIGFSAEVDPLAVGAETVLDPPTAETAYWLSDYGLAGRGAENTVYVIGHASADGRAVFDPLVDRAAGRGTVMPGDEILVDTANGTAVYEVVSVERHDKTALADLANVWTSAPERLVLITCFFTAAGEAPDNMVVFARLNGGA